jgi:acyl-CoA thioester hydrolase
VTARGDQLIDNYGLDTYVLAKEQGVCWVSAQTQISYLAPALPMEEVTIQTQLISCTEKSLLLEGTMWNQDKSHLKTVMWAKLVHFDLKTQRSQTHSEDLMHLFRQIVNPLDTDYGFEQRIAFLKTSS